MAITTKSSAPRARPRLPARSVAAAGSPGGKLPSVPTGNVGRSQQMSCHCDGEPADAGRIVTRSAAAGGGGDGDDVGVGDDGSGGGRRGRAGWGAGGASAERTVGGSSIASLGGETSSGSAGGAAPAVMIAA